MTLLRRALELVYVEQVPEGIRYGVMVCPEFPFFFLIYGFAMVMFLFCIALCRSRLCHFLHSTCSRV